MNDLISKIRDLDNQMIHDRILAGLLDRGRPSGMLEKLVLDANHHGLLFTLGGQADSEILGYLAASPEGEWIHLEEMAVERSHRRQKHGTALVTMLQRECVARSSKGITLTTDRELPENFEFYKRLGFSVCLPDEFGQPKHLAQRLREEHCIYKFPSRRVGMVKPVRT